MSKGIRIYWHDAGKRRTRESLNYFCGMQVVESLISSKTVRIIATGVEEGAMCLHYERIWK